MRSVAFFLPPLLSRLLPLLLLLGCHGAGPAAKFVVVNADATRSSDSHVAVTTTLRNDAGVTRGPYCVRVEWMDASANLLEAQDTCTGDVLDSGATRTFTLRSYGALQAAGGHVVVSVQYAPGHSAGADTLTVAMPS